MENKIPYLLLIWLFFAACQQPVTTFYSKERIQGLLPDSAGFIDTIEGQQTRLFTLNNKHGMLVSITNYGGRIVGLIVPDKNQQPVDVVLGMDTPAAYRASGEPYYGALIGRVANRIAGGTFTLEGKTYHLPLNNGVNTLHGGLEGFQYKVWDARQTSDSTLILRYRSTDGEEGFPGNLDVEVTYTLSKAQKLCIQYKATSDQNTPVNLTNHAFFNLNGSGPIAGHMLEIPASRYTPVDSTLIPFGTLAPVEGTPFDFQHPTQIGARIATDDLQLNYGKGYDHNFVLKQAHPGDLIKAARLQGDQSGIVMDIYTTQPGLQFYSGNFMDGTNRLKNGIQDDYRTAVALEPQHFPDALHHANFPDIILKAGAEYHTYSEYRFSTAD